MALTIVQPGVGGTGSSTASSTGSGAAVLATQPSFPSTIGVGGATASSSGSGISFPATQSASTDANTLDDYEEGTFTPVLTFNNSSTGITYSEQNGMYVKVGQLVHVQIILVLSNKGSASGQASITVPFTAISGVYYTSGCFSSNQLTLASGSYNFSYQMGEGATKFDWYNQVSGGNKTGLTNTQFANNTEIILGFTYRASA